MTCYKYQILMEESLTLLYSFKRASMAVIFFAIFCSSSLTREVKRLWLLGTAAVPVGK